MGSDIANGDHIATRTIVMQQKTERPVQFEITEQTKKSVRAWIEQATLKSDYALFGHRLHDRARLSTRQHARIVHRRVRGIGVDAAGCRTHTMRQTKATLIYGRTKNLRAVQLLAHIKLESSVRYLGIELDEALEMAEQTEV